MTRALLEFAFALIAAIGVFGTAALLASVQTTGYCAVSAPRLSLLLSCPLVGLVATVTLIALPAVGATTTVSAATFTYDAPTISRVDVHASGAADAESAQLRGSREGFASPPVQAREASTTQLALINATNTADDLAGAASRASSTVGPGRGPVYGTNVHTAFADEVAALGRSDLFTEVSYLNGQVVPYGTRGAVRLDVVVGSPSAPTAIWDLKTGSAALTQARIAQIQSHLPPAFQNIPVLEVRP